MFLQHRPHETTQRLERITPEQAAALLKNNVNNRPIKSRKLSALKKDLLNGNFKLTHQGIAVDWNGNLIDGQHRLTAIAESGIPAQLYVTYNCDPEIFNVIDCGAVRNPSDVLKTLGASNYSVIASGVRLILWAHSNYAAQLSPNTGNTVTKSFSATNADISAFYSANTELLNVLGDDAKKLHRISRSLVPSAITAFFYLVRERQRSMHADAYEFLERVAKGADLRAGSVELAFVKFISNRFTDMRGYKKGEFMLAAYIKAYNRYLDGDAVIQFRVGNLDHFPCVTEI